MTEKVMYQVTVQHKGEYSTRIAGIYKTKKAAERQLSEILKDKNMFGHITKCVVTSG